MKQKKDQITSIRFTKDQKDKIIEMSKASGFSISQLIEYYIDCFYKHYEKFLKK